MEILSDLIAAVRLGPEMSYTGGFLLIGPCISLPFALIGAAVAAGVAGLRGASRVARRALYGAVGGVIGGWLPYVSTVEYDFPQTTDFRVLAGLAMLGAAAAGGLLLSTFIAGMGKKQ